MIKEETRDDSDDNIYSIFEVGDSLCGIRLSHIQEINRNFDLTPVPGAAGFIDGIANLRGNIVTIIDLRKKLGIASQGMGKDNRNIIINADNEYIGLKVDAVKDVVNLEEGNLEPAPANIGQVSGAFFTGVLKTRDQLIGILDVDQILKE